MISLIWLPTPTHTTFLTPSHKLILISLHFRCSINFYLLYVNNFTSFSMKTWRYKCLFILKILICLTLLNICKTFTYKMMPLINDISMSDWSFLSVSKSAIKLGKIWFEYNFLQFYPDCVSNTAPATCGNERWPKSQFYPLITNIHKNLLPGLCNLSSQIKIRNHE